MKTFCTIRRQRWVGAGWRKARPEHEVSYLDRVQAGSIGMSWRIEHRVNSRKLAGAEIWALCQFLLYTHIPMEKWRGVACPPVPSVQPWGRP